jgi:isocitrate lyase
MGIEGIYLGGWATSARGSVTEDPGPDLASYPLSQVPDEAAPIVRALLTADRNQRFARSRLSEAQRAASPEIDYRPFIIADADTGHGGDAHVRNLVRRFVEVGVPGYHIEDQKPGAKKCGHQGGKVLVGVDEQIKRLSAARFQLDVMRVPGVIVARTDAEAATFLEGRGDERDHPFILGATNVELPTYKVGYLAILRKLRELGVDDARGHLLFKISAEEYDEASAWLARTGVMRVLEESAEAFQQAGGSSFEALMDRVETRYLEAWQSEASLKSYPEAVADVIEFRVSEGEIFDMSAAEWLAFANRTSFHAARARARSMGVDIAWDCEVSKTTEGYYQVQGGIEYAVARSLAVAPFADILWMETKTANLADARRFAEAIHAEFPAKMLAYNLSPSFNWDTTGMSEEEMRRFPQELGKLGFVFNFITYGGHQIDGLAAEEFATALKQDGMLSLARLQRKLRLVESPYRTPQTLVGGPRLDAALMASSGGTAATKAMGKGSTQHQHLVQTEVPTKLLEEWLATWTRHHQVPGSLRVGLRPNTAGSELLELTLSKTSGERVANIIFDVIVDRRGRNILSIRDQNTFDTALRKKRLMTLNHLFLVHRYKVRSVHYVSPTDDNRYQAQKMKAHGLFSDVHDEVGDVIVADVSADGVKALLAPDRDRLNALIQRKYP